ncbi:MAG: hypothetical protein EBS77_09525 [Gammaproteobacteria bacterium]|nr:hypothetical protein [Gammaproteobacteria bacterium]
MSEPLREVNDRLCGLNALHNASLTVGAQQLTQALTAALWLFTGVDGTWEFSEDPLPWLALKPHDADGQIMFKHFKASTAESFDSHHKGRLHVGLLF